MKTSLQTVLLLFELSFLAAQNGVPFWVEDFSDMGKFTTVWINGGQNTGTEVWKWSNNPQEATFGNQPKFASKTNSNGYILFNSDANGNNAFQVSTTSPPIDISNREQLFLQFESQYGYFSRKESVKAELGYSFDGLTFTYLPLFDFIPKNTLRDSVILQIVEIPLKEAEQDLYLQFRWKGQYEYAWKIDDLALYDSNPTPPNDLSISFPKGASNYMTPISQAQPVEFAATINNKGTLQQKNIKVKASVYFDDMEVFNTYANVDQLSPDSSRLITFQQKFIPRVEGAYQIFYEVIPEKTTDDVPLNNKVSMPFILSENLFSKDDHKIIGATQPSAPGSENWEAGNLYQIHKSGFSAFKAQISVMSPTGPNGYKGASVAVFLYEVNDQNSEETITDENLSIVGYGSYTFGSEPAFEVVSVDLYDILTGEPGVKLKEHFNYLLAVQYPNDLLVPYTTLPYFYDYATVVKNTRWYPGGFGPEITVVARMVIQDSHYSGMTTSSTHLKAGEELRTRLYPNPSSDYLYLESADTDSGLLEVNWAITDLQGKVLKHNYGAFLSANSPISINIVDLPSGTYVVEITAGKKTKSMPFVKN